MWTNEITDTLKFEWEALKGNSELSQERCIFWVEFEFNTWGRRLKKKSNELWIIG